MPVPPRKDIVKEKNIDQLQAEPNKEIVKNSEVKEEKNEKVSVAETVKTEVKKE